MQDWQDYQDKEASVFFVVRKRLDTLVGALTLLSYPLALRQDRKPISAFSKNVENNNVVFGLRREMFKHQPTYPNALRTTEI
ncbi:hypothetical protein C6495_08570 [Candidatus Poribacteria bacterium]|nr:MAG: hypothetical protein C6495_08570 [Candidatus Poribacteria bacterium]